MFILTVYTLLVTVLILLYIHVTRHFKYWEKKNVPYIKPIPIFGNILPVIMFKKSIGKFLGDLYHNTKLPYQGFFIFDQPFLLIRNPDIIKSILIKDFDHFSDRSVSENKRDDKLGSSILFILKNPTWKKVRTKVTPLFSTGKIRNMFHLIMESSNDLVDYINNNCLTERSSDCREIAMKYTTDVIASCAFGINTHSFKSDKSEFHIMCQRFFMLNFSRSIQMASYFIAPFLVRLLRMKFLEPLASQYMAEVFLKTMHKRELSGVERGDLIDILIKLNKKDEDSGFKLDEDILVAQAIQFLSAGFETSGSTISFALYELSLNSEVQEYLRDEIISMYTEHGSLSYEVVQQMKYLDMVVCEVLRKYPVLPYLDRRCTNTYQIPGTDVIIEKGIPVYIPLFGLHYDPEYYPNPEKFDPERFSETNRKSIPTFVYLPFGEGLHNCIGLRFALLSVKVALVRILEKFKIEPSEDTPIPLVLDSKGCLIAPKDKLIPLHFRRWSE